MDRFLSHPVFKSYYLGTSCCRKSVFHTNACFIARALGHSASIRICTTNRVPALRKQEPLCFLFLGAQPVVGYGRYTSP